MRRRPRIGVSSLRVAAAHLSAVCSSVSPNTCRRSECPTSANRAPASRAIGAELSPVNAPLSSVQMFWTPIPTSGRDPSAAATVLTDSAGGKRITVRSRRAGHFAVNSATNARAAFGP
jgi:hypothetical protein